MSKKKKLPINLTLEIKRYPEPNECWYDVTGVLSWAQAGYVQRMDTAMCTEDELDSTKEAIQFLVGEAFSIQCVTEQRTGVIHAEDHRYPV